MEKNEIDKSKLTLSRTPPERTGHVSACVDKYMIIWGGYNDDYIPSNMNWYLPPDEIWIYDLEFKVWFVSKTEKLHPIEASGCTACVHGGFMYLFGGHSHQGNLNELYALKLNNLQWEHIQPTSVRPSPRDKTTSWYYEKKLYVFGGFGISQHDYLEEYRTFVQDETSDLRGWNNQLVVYDFETNVWSVPTSKGERPSPRAAHTAVRFGHKVYIFGGRHMNQRLNDLHCLDLSNMIWSGRITTLGDIPEGRSWHTATPVSDTQMFVYGGFNTECQPLGDAWILDVKSLQWTIIDHLPKDRPRLWHTACVTRHKEIIVYGGCGNNILDNDVGVDHRNDIIWFQLQVYSLQRICLEYIYQHRTRLADQWDSLPRSLCDWLRKKEDLDIRLMMSSDSDSESNSVEEYPSGQTCTVS